MKAARITSLAIALLISGAAVAQTPPNAQNQPAPQGQGQGPANTAGGIGISNPPALAPGQLMNDARDGGHPPERGASTYAPPHVSR